MKFEDYLEQAMQQVYEEEVKAAKIFHKTMIDWMKELKHIFSTLPDSEEMEKFLDCELDEVSKFENHWSFLQLYKYHHELLVGQLDSYIEGHENLERFEALNELVEKIKEWNGFKNKDSMNEIVNGELGNE